MFPPSEHSVPKHTPQSAERCGLSLPTPESSPRQACVNLHTVIIVGEVMRWSLLWGFPVHCRLFSGVLDLYSSRLSFHDKLKGLEILQKGLWETNHS